MPQPSLQELQTNRSLRRTRRQTVAYLLAFLVCLAILVSAAVAQSPAQLKPQGYVNDFANVLSPSAREQLSALCAEVDAKANAQIAVVTVKSLEGQTAFDYSLNLAVHWGVGPKQKDNGVLILFAINDHKYWTQVGYGLEGILPDGKVGGFGREAVPLLREGNYDGAIELVARRVADVIAAARGITLSGTSPAPPPFPEPTEHRGATWNPLGIILLILIIYAIIRAISSFTPPSSGNHRGGGGWWVGPMIGGGWGGGGFGGGGWGGGGGGSSGGFGGFGGGSFGGGGAGGSW